MLKNSILFSGSSNLSLAKRVAKDLNISLGKITIKKFSDQETYINIRGKIKNKKVFILQSCSAPANEFIMELLIIIDAIKRLHPKSITALIPFYGYRRQEKKTEKGESITAQLVARILETAGINKVVLLDIHSKKILKFFKIPVIHLTALPLFVKYFLKQNQKNIIIIAPDRGASARAKYLAKELKIPSFFITKSRSKKHDVVSKIKLQKPLELKNRNVIIIDDEINTGGTIIKVIKFLKKQGIKNIWLAFTHPVLSKNAIQKLKKAPIKCLITTDTIYLPIKNRIKKLRILSVSKIISEGIKSWA